MDRLRERKEVSDDSPRYERGCPIFEGKVMSISGKLFQNGEIFSCLDYLPAGQQFPKQNFGAILVMSREYEEEYKAACMKMLRRVLVPFPVDVEVLQGAEVRGFIDNFEGIAVYTLEVTVGKDLGGLDFVAAMSGSDSRARAYTGFKYIKAI